MDKRVKIIITIFLLVILFFTFYFITKAVTHFTGYTITGGTIDEGRISEFVGCLNEKGVFLYCLDKAKICNEQKKLFGMRFNLKNYVDCEKQVNRCEDIKEFPLWKIDGKVYYGWMSLDEVSEFSKCDL
ncbi:MAG: hypothetical protein ABIG37_03780 [Nanoarchaeota archaeon]|nr:hypothetical protein [Nanoarchaeota archaeon]